jgi:mRNA interferase HigB
MRIVSKSTLKVFWENPENRDAEKELINWHKAITEGVWNTPNDIVGFFKGADTVR